MYIPVWRHGVPKILQDIEYRNHYAIMEYKGDVDKINYRGTVMQYAACHCTIEEFNYLCSRSNYYIYPYRVWKYLIIYQLLIKTL